MRHLFYFILLIGIVSCHNSRKDQKNASEQGLKSLNINVIKDVSQRDSLQKQRENQIYKSWVECDSMPYFLLDKQIVRQLKNPKLNQTDELILKYRLVFFYFYRGYIYDSIQYKNKAIDLFVETLNSDKYLLRSSVYFKTTPEKLKSFLQEVENIKNTEEKTSFVWNKLNSDKRLSNY